MPERVARYLLVLLAALLLVGFSVATVPSDVRYMPQVVYIHEKVPGVLKVSLLRNAGFSQRLTLHKASGRDEAELLNLVCEGDAKSKSAEIAIEGPCRLKVRVDSFDWNINRWKSNHGRWTTRSTVLEPGETLTLKCEDLYPADNADFDDAVASLSFAPRP